MELTKVSEFTEALFESRFEQTGLHQVCTYSLLHNPKMKFNPIGLCGKVYKTPEIVKHAAYENNNSKVPDFVIVINDDIFNMVESEEYQIMMIDKIYAQMGFDFEKDTTTIVTPNVQEFSGILRKYEFNKLEALNLHIEGLFEKLNEMGESTKKSAKVKVNN